MDAQGNVTNEIWAIVQTCKYQVGTAKCQQQQMEETNLCSCWQFSMKHVSQQGGAFANSSDQNMDPAAVP
jgi:hypothetical protein